MIDQLKEMLEMQKMLDASIFAKHGIKSYPYENMRIALFVELGELLNELPSKHPIRGIAAWNPPKYKPAVTECFQLVLVTERPLQIETAKASIARPTAITNNSTIPKSKTSFQITII